MEMTTIRMETTKKIMEIRRLMEITVVLTTAIKTMEEMEITLISIMHRKLQ